MDRREYLGCVSGVITGFSGCTGKTDQGREQATSKTTTPVGTTANASISQSRNSTEKQQSTSIERTSRNVKNQDTELSRQRTVSLETINRQPVDYDINLAVDIIEPTVTEDHTARIQINFANEGEVTSPDIYLIREPIVNIAKDFTYSAPQVYVLVPSQKWYIDQPNKCWTTPDGWGSAGGETLRLHPEESVTQRYLLGNKPPTKPCMPTGIYRFGGKWPAPDRAASFTWMFTLSIDK